jgi:hypothetical protein
MLLPLGIGLALKSRYAELAARVKPVLDVMVIVVAIVGLIILMPVSRALANR